MDLIYSDIHGYLVFLPRSKALQLEGLRLAISEATTWNDLKRSVVWDLYRSLVARYREDADIDEDEPADWEPAPDTLFEAPGMDDGDYPDWPAQDALGWVPQDIQRQFGRVVSSTHNGEYLELASKHEEPIITAFAEHGFRCTRDDGLVRRAHGYQ